MRNLFQGAVVVVDDEVGSDEEIKEANINKLISDIKNKGFPCATLQDIPSDIDNFVQHLHSVAFLVLDWKLNSLSGKEDDPELAGIFSPEAVGERTLKLLKKIKEIMFLPVFIFTDEEIGGIEDCLVEAGLYVKDNESHNFILVRKKEALLGGKFLHEIENWISQSPSVYVLKEWDRAYQTAKSTMFQNFYDKSHTWPKILWDTFEKDGVTPSEELSGVLTRNLSTRMSLFDFDKSVIEATSEESNKETLRRVLQGERFVPNENLHEKNLAAGDIFKLVEDQDCKYLINIRPNCDTVLTRKGNHNPDLFFLCGRKTVLNRKEHWNRTHLREKESSFIIPCVVHGEVLEFDLKSFHSKPWCSVKTKRIGRLLNPHLNRLLQKFNSTMFRQGVPASPKEAYFD